MRRAGQGAELRGCLRRRRAARLPLVSTDLPPSASPAGPASDPPERDAHEEHPAKRAARFERIRRMKWLLRYMPRRARFPHYPLVGRFAEVARKRAYLWSFKPEAMRPAFYVGSILALLPVMGAQLPLGLVLAVLLRCNFMVVGGLQFITNPVTAAPIYFATHQLGALVIRGAGFGHALPAADPHEAVLPLEEDEPLAPGAAVAAPSAPAERRGGAFWARRIGTAFNALIIGGILSGAALGLVLDILYRNYWEHHLHATPRRRRPPRSPPAGPA